MSQLQSDILARTRPRRWDDPQADGQTLAEQIRAKLVSPVATAQPVAEGQQVRYKASDNPLAIDGSAPAQPATPTLSAPLAAIRDKFAKMNSQPPQTSGAINETDQPMREMQDNPYADVQSEDEMATTGRPWKAGYGVGETDPLKRDAARIRAMIENPISEVNPDGSVQAPHPLSKKKAALLGLLMGMGKAAEGHPYPSLARVLAGGATGAVIGGIKPKAIQEWRRRNEVDEAQGNLAGQQSTTFNQGRIEEQQAATRQKQLAPEIAAAEVERKLRYDQARLQIQKDVAEGRKSTADATRELKKLEMGEQKRHNLETEKISRDRPVSSANDGAAEEGEALANLTRADADTLKAELDQHKGQLTENEKALTAKEAVWNKRAQELLQSDDTLKTAYMADPKKGREAALEQAKAEDPDVQSGVYDQTVTNTKALRDAIGEKEKRLSGMQGTIRGGQAKAARRRPSLGSAAPSTHGFSVSGWLARNPGKTEADARAFHDGDPKYSAFKIIP